MGELSYHAINCDACAEDFRDDDGDCWFSSATIARGFARIAGWKCDGDGDLCPVCWAQRPRIPDGPSSGFAVAQGMETAKAKTDADTILYAKRREDEN